MTNQERVALFQQALLGIQKLENLYPGYPPFVSIHNQLLYLLGTAQGGVADPKVLAQINLGYITMREVEPRDEAIAELLYKVSAEVEQMKRQAPGTA